MPQVDDRANTPHPDRASSELPKFFEPFDGHNQRLQDAVSPGDWVNPTPAENYNLVVIGAGTAGLVTAAGAAGLGAKVALIERHAMGGDCLNVGCVPSKALIAAARAAAHARRASRLGVYAEGVTIDFAAVMERLRKRRADISPNDSVARFRDLGVDVFLGDARFLDKRTVEVGGMELKFSKAVIATGARAAIIPIPGLAESGPLTNETLFSLTKLPRRLAVIGAGPIGCEMAQAFARFGSEVTLFEAADHILPREDPDAAETVTRALGSDEVNIQCGANIERIERDGETRRIVLRTADGTVEWEFDHILVGVGRAPNVDGLGLEAAGVKFNHKTGIQISEQLRTTNPRIFAVGDVCLPYKFTHTADAAARIVIQNALFAGRKKHTDLVVPWCTYTDPEIAHTGLYKTDAEKRGIRVAEFKQDFADVDRAILEEETEGFVRVLIDSSNGKIIGGTIVGPHAGDMISQLTVAIRAGMKLGELASVIHPYPTLAEAIRRTGDQYNRTRLTPTIKSVMKTWLRWSR